MIGPKRWKIEQYGNKVMVCKGHHYAHEECSFEELTLEDIQELQAAVPYPITTDTHTCPHCGSCIA